MSFRSLIPKCIRNFSHSRIKVIMLQDYPEVGFQGQVVSVKPGYAETFLMPRKLAVYNFPRTHERLFPNWDESQIEIKREQVELRNFIKKFDNIQVELKKAASPTNPTFLKEPLKAKDVSEQLKAKMGLEIPPANFKFNQEINEYGSFIIAVEAYHNERFNKKFNFKLRVNIEQETLVGEEAVEDTGFKI